MEDDKGHTYIVTKMTHNSIHNIITYNISNNNRCTLNISCNSIYDLQCTTQHIMYTLLLPQCITITTTITHHTKSPFSSHDFKVSNLQI